MASIRCMHAPKTANLFVQLSMGSRAPATTQPVLDLLLPLRTAQAYHATVRAGAPRLAQPARAPPAGLASRHAHRRQTAAPRRTFGTSATRPATHAVFNPVQDEEGADMKLEITPRAAKRLSEIMAKDGNPYLALRIQVESGGCHGFQYLMSLVTLPPDLPPGGTPSTTGGDQGAEPAVREDDTIFVYAPDGQEIGGAAGGDLTAPKIILDAPSLELLKGSKVDFTMELIGSQFKIVDNPLATSSCGCGTSFDIKI